MPALDLTPFGFTPTESAAYGALLRLGPTTGYSVAQAIRVARANTYAALEGLVCRAAAVRVDGKPTRYRPVDPQALLAQLGESQALALEALGDQLAAYGHQDTAVTQRVQGARAAASALVPLIARVERELRGTIPAELWRLTLPAWRRAAAHAHLEVRVAGPLETEETGGIPVGRADSAAPGILVFDTRAVVVTAGTGESVLMVWSFDPLLVQLGLAALAGRAVLS